MARTNSRFERMDKKFQLRCTQSDLTAIKQAAYRKGIDSSQLIRSLLIDAEVISPTGKESPIDF